MSITLVADTNIIPTEDYLVSEVVPSSAQTQWWPTSIVFIQQGETVYLIAEIWLILFVPRERFFRRVDLPAELSSSLQLNRRDHQKRPHLSMFAIRIALKFEFF